MPRTTIGLKDFKRDPVTHFVMPVLIEFLTQFIFTFWGVMAEKPRGVAEDPVVVDVNANATVVVTPVFEDADYVVKNFGPCFQTGLSVWLCIMLYSKMSYAPAQFNPAITTTLVVVGTIPPLLFIPNILCQLVSSTLAAYVSQLIRGAPPPALVIPDDVSSVSIFFNEVIMVASVTMLVAELTQNPRMSDPLGDLGVGMSVFMCLLCGRWMGVICMSTSRVFGPAVLMGGKAWNRHWLLWLGDLTGATIAGVFWLMFLAPPDRSWLGRFVRNKPQKTDILMEEKSSNKDISE